MIAYCGLVEVHQGSLNRWRSSWVDRESCTSTCEAWLRPASSLWVDAWRRTHRVFFSDADGSCPWREAFDKSGTAWGGSQASSNAGVDPAVEQVPMVSVL